MCCNFRPVSFRNIRRVARKNRAKRFTASMAKNTAKAGPNRCSNRCLYGMRKSIELKSHIAKAKSTVTVAMALFCHMSKRLVAAEIGDDQAERIHRYEV